MNDVHVLVYVRDFAAVYCTQYYPAKENDYKQCGRTSDLQHILTVLIYRKGGHWEFTRDRSVQCQKD